MSYSSIQHKLQVACAYLHFISTTVLQHPEYTFDPERIYRRKKKYMDSQHGCTKNVARPFTSFEVFKVVCVGVLVHSDLCMCWCQYLHTNIGHASWHALSLLPDLVTISVHALQREIFPLFSMRFVNRTRTFQLDYSEGVAIAILV